MRKISILVVSLLLVASACGVKGPPRPPDMAKPAQTTDGGLADGGK